MPETKKFPIDLPWGVLHGGILLRRMVVHEIDNAAERVLSATVDDPEYNRILEFLTSTTEAFEQSPCDVKDGQAEAPVTDREQLRKLLETVVDVDSLVAVLEIRKASLGHVYEFTHPCKHCKGKMEQEFDLRTIQIVDPSDPLQRELVFNIPGRATASLTFRLSTLADSNLQRYVGTVNDGRMTARDVALPLVKVGDELAPQPIPNRRSNVITLREQEDALEKRVALVEEHLHTSGLKQEVLKARRRWEAGADFIVSSTCPNPRCACEQYTRVPVEPEFFLTASRDRPMHRDRTRFGTP